MHDLHASAPPRAPGVQLLGVLRGALALGNPKLAEPALSCMHKLVAYAYLQGETGPSGRLDDDTNIVTQASGRDPHMPLQGRWQEATASDGRRTRGSERARWRRRRWHATVPGPAHAEEPRRCAIDCIGQEPVSPSPAACLTCVRTPLQVVALTARCGESSTTATQLQVVKALLTCVTGEAWGSPQARTGTLPAAVVAASQPAWRPPLHPCCGSHRLACHALHALACQGRPCATAAARRLFPPSIGLTPFCPVAFQIFQTEIPSTRPAAEHFLAHGDCLMQAVRAVFNLAIGAESADIKSTARSALLQMVNTVLKRVGQQILVGAALRRRVWPVPGGRCARRGAAALRCRGFGDGAEGCDGCCRQRCPQGVATWDWGGCCYASGNQQPSAPHGPRCGAMTALWLLHPACLQSPNGTPLPSPAATYFRPLQAGSTGSASTENVSSAAANAAAPSASADQAGGGGGSSAAGGNSDGTPSAPSSVQGGGLGPGSVASAGGGRLSQANSDADLLAQQPAPTGGRGGSPAQPLSPAESGRLMQALSAEMDVHAPNGNGGADGCQGGESLRPAPPAPLALPPGIAASPPGSSAATSPAAGPPAGLGSAPSTGVAEAADAAAVAADIAELQAALPRIHTSPPTPTHGGAAEEAAAEQFVAAAVQADARTAQLASLAEQSDLRGLERALDSLPQAEPTPSSLPKLSRQDTPPDPRRWTAVLQRCRAPRASLQAAI